MTKNDPPDLTEVYRATTTREGEASEMIFTRASKYQREEFDKRYEKLGLKKVYFTLPSGRQGFNWSI